MFVGRKLSIGSVFWFVNVGFAFADGVVQIVSDTKPSGDLLLASPKADVTSVRCLPDDEKYLRNLFSNEGMFSKDSVEKGAVLLRLSWKREYYRSCRKLFSAGEKRKQADLLATLDKSGKTGFAWMCYGWRRLSAVGDACLSKPPLVSSKAFSEEVFRNFINKVLSLCNKHSQLSFEILKALVMPNGKLLMPIADFPQGIDASKVIYLLCDFGKPKSFVERVKCKVLSFTNAVFELKPMQVSVVISAVLTLLCIWEKWRALHKEESARKNSEGEKELANQVKSVLAKLECIKSVLSDKSKCLDPELRAEFGRLRSELLGKFKDFESWLSGQSELLDKLKEFNADSDRCKSLDEQIHKLSADFEQFREVFIKLHQPQGACPLPLAGDGDQRERKSEVPHHQGESVEPVAAGESSKVGGVSLL